MNRRRKFKLGFTLVELLVVIAIIGILVALLLPAVQAAREAARRMSCSNNLKQLALGLHNYHDTYKAFPPDAIWLGNPKGTTASSGQQRNYSWIALMLPYIEQGPLHDQINFERPAYIQGGVTGNANAGELQRIVINNDAALAFSPSVVLCPSDPTFTSPPRGIGITSYAGNAGWDAHRRRFGDSRLAGVFPLYDNTRLRDIIDGTSNTVMLGEVTTRGYCCRPGGSGDPNRWNGGSGKLRHSRQSVSRGALIAVAAWSGWNHSWMRAENKGSLLRADGTPGPIWGQWTSPNHIMSPSYYPHYSMNTEWPAPGSVHSGGAQFALADASVRFIPETITTGGHDPFGRGGNVWMAMHTVEGIPGEAQVEFP